MDLSNALEYLRANHHSILVARKPGGDPQPSPVVHGVDDHDRIVISSREPAYKVRNLRRDPRATLCAIPDKFFGRWIVVEGTAEIIALPDAMDGLVDLYRQVAGDHQDWDEYRTAMVSERRVIIAVTPTSAGPERSG